MVSHLFFSQLVLVALVWLCVMLHWAWPSDPQPNTFCVRCAMAAPNSTRTSKIPTSPAISCPPGALERANL